MDEIRAMLRSWIDDVRCQDMPPEQALKEFKAMLPMGGTFRNRRESELGGRNASELISIFIEEYYRGENDSREADSQA